MKRIALLTCCTLALAGCQFSIGTNEEVQLENSVRDSLVSHGNVQEVDLTKTDDNHFTGFARVRDAQGNEGRYNCTAERTGGSGTNFTWRCVPTIADADLRLIENTIRTSLASQGSVEQVQMTKENDNRMSGFAQLRNAYGAVGRFACSAVREGDTSRFNWRCAPPGEAAPTDEATTEPPADSSAPAQEDTGDK